MHLFHISFGYNTGFKLIQGGTKNKAQPHEANRLFASIANLSQHGGESGYVACMPRCLGCIPCYHFSLVLIILAYKESIVLWLIPLLGSNHETINIIKVSFEKLCQADGCNQG